MNEKFDGSLLFAVPKSWSVWSSVPRLLLWPLWPIIIKCRVCTNFIVVVYDQDGHIFILFCDERKIFVCRKVNEKWISYCAVVGTTTRTTTWTTTSDGQQLSINIRNNKKNVRKQTS